MKRKLTLTEFARKGGRARAEKLTPERRQEIAKIAVKARIDKAKKVINSSSLQDV